MMLEKSKRFRWLSQRLPSSRKRRLVVLTGARQTGKTTLALGQYSDLRHINLDEIEVREDLGSIRTASWADSVGPAVIDEAQKQPSVFEKLKYAYDRGEIDFSVLLGSSRIMLMEQVKESLAGRAFLYDLWPLMPSELLTPATETPPLPLLDELLEKPARFSSTMAKQPTVWLGDRAEQARQAVEHLERWGGMPEVLRLDAQDRVQWLRSYRKTFLERDLADLVRLSDLQPFVKLTKLAMLRVGGLLSFSELARDATLSPTTVKRYLEYLRISYQTLQLQPFSRNLTSSVVKTPKLYWIDLGVLRQAIRDKGPATGAIFENLVVAEINKWIQTMGRDVDLTFYRTRSGFEIDLMLETSAGYIAAEIKSREGPHRGDLRHLKTLAKKAPEGWLGGLVIHRGRKLELMDEEFQIWAVPLHRLLT